jgi:hypothetical protein
MGYWPSLEEALGRLERRKRNGDSDEAFGWRHLQEAKMWRTHGCGTDAA